MSSWNEAIIDQEVKSAEDARQLAGSILTWLVEEQIIQDRQSDGCLEGACYPPGPRFMQACGGQEDDASNGNYARLSQIATNGLYVVTTRATP